MQKLPRRLLADFGLLWLVASLGWLGYAGGLSIGGMAASAVFGLPSAFILLVAIRIFRRMAGRGVWHVLNTPVDPRLLALLTPAGLFGAGLKSVIGLGARAAEPRRALRESLKDR